MKVVLLGKPWFQEMEVVTSAKCCWDRTWGTKYVLWIENLGVRGDLGGSFSERKQGQKSLEWKRNILEQRWRSGRNYYRPLFEDIWLWNFLKDFFFFFYCGWVFIAACRLSLDEVRGASLLQYPGCSLPWFLFLQSTGSRRLGFRSFSLLALENWLSSFGAWGSCPVACGIFQDQGSNQCPLHCKADS